MSKTRSGAAREQPIMCRTIAMTAYPRCPYFQKKLGEFRERCARVILSETKTEFKLTQADQDLLKCDRVDIRLSGDLRNVLKDTKLAAMTDHSTIGQDSKRSSTERPVISVLTVNVRFETIGQLRQTLKQKIDQFDHSEYDIIYVEAEGCEINTEGVQKTIGDVIKHKFTNIDTGQQLVITLSGQQCTDASSADITYHEHNPVSNTTIEDDKRSNKTAATDKSPHECAFPNTPIQTRSRAAQKHDRPDSSSSSTSDKSPSKLKRLDSSSSDEQSFSDMEISHSESDNLRLEGTGPYRQQEGSRTPKSPPRRFNLLRLGSSESEEPMDIACNDMEAGFDSQRDQQQQDRHHRQKQEQRPQHQHDLRSRRNLSPDMPVQSGSRPSEGGTRKSLHSKSVSILSQGHHKHQHQRQLTSLLRHEKHHHHQQEQHRQSSSTYNEVTAILVSELNLGKAISFRIEDRLFRFLSTVEKALREAKRFLDDNRSSGSPQFTTIDKLLFEMRGYYNHGMSTLCLQKQAVYRSIPRDLMNEILDIEDVLGCGRVYGRFTIHIRDDTSIDTDRLRTNVRNCFRKHQFETDEEIIIEKMIRDDRCLSLTAA